MPLSHLLTDAPASLTRRRLVGLARTASDDVWLADAEGNLLTDLPRWRGVTGQSVEELLGAGWLDGVHPEDRERAGLTWAAAVAGRHDYVVEYRLFGRGGERWLLVRGAPVADDEGGLVEWIGTITDITQQKAAGALGQEAAREREALAQVIAQTPSAICLTTGPDHVYRYVNDAYLALVPTRRVEVGRPVAEAQPEVALAALPLLDRAYEGETVEVQALPIPSSGPGAFRGHRWYRCWYRPLLAHGSPVGVVVTAIETTEDVRLREDLRVQLATERTLAERLQDALLPDELPTVAGLDVGRRYLTAREEAGVGGDWYDLLALPDGRVLLSLGDISGRGLTAASQMGQVRAAIRAFATAGGSVTEILGRTAAYVQAVGLADMITAAVALLDPATGALSYATAAHPSPLVLDRDGLARYLDGPSNAPLGIGASYVGIELRLGAGESLVLYTDGLVEQRGRSLGDTLDELLAHAGTMPSGAGAQELADLLGAFGPAGEQGADDTAILVVRRVAG